MLDLIKKGMLASLGAAVVTREKIKEKTQHLVDEGKLTVEETERLAKELVEGGEGQWEAFKEEIQETMRSSLHKLDIGSKEEFEELKSRLTQIEQRLTIIEERLPSSGGGPGSASA